MCWLNCGCLSVTQATSAPETHTFGHTLQPDTVWSLRSNPAEFCGIVYPTFQSVSRDVVNKLLNSLAPISLRVIPVKGCVRRLITWNPILWNMACGWMSRVFQHIMCSLERDVVSKDLGKNLRTWHNRVTAVTWYNLYISCQKRQMYCTAYYNFHISYPISVGVGECDCHLFSFHRSPAHWLYVYTINIFPEFICLHQSFIYVRKISRHEGVLEEVEDEDLKWLPQMSHKDSALMLFPLSVYLSMSRYVTTYKDEMVGPLLLATTCIKYQIIAIWLLNDESKDDQLNASHT